MDNLIFTAIGASSKLAKLSKLCSFDFVGSRGNHHLLHTVSSSASKSSHLHDGGGPPLGKGK